MRRLGAGFIVELHGLGADTAALGKSITIPRGSERWRIDFPEAPDSFRFMHATTAVAEGGTKDPRDYAPTTALVHEGTDLVTIRLVRVVVNFDGELSVDGYDAERDDARYEELVHAYAARAVEMAADLSARVRLDLGQFWVEPTGQFPRVVSAMGLVDLESQRAFPHAIVPAGSVLVIDRTSPLSADAVVQIEASMVAGPLSTEEVLLSEACYLVEGPQQGAGDRATLLAAIAVELRTKSALRVLAGDDLANVVDLLLEHPRDWSMSAHGLYLKAVPALAGRDLGKEHTDSARGVQRLFTDRNRIAHRGSTVSMDEAKAHVMCARNAFELLRPLVAGG